MRDDGPGFPEEFRLDLDGGQGLELVDALCGMEMCGAMSFGTDCEGAHVTLEFPVSPVEDERQFTADDTPFCSMDGVVCF